MRCTNKNCCKKVCTCHKKQVVTSVAALDTQKAVLKTTAKYQCSWCEIEAAKSSLKIGDEVDCVLKNGKKVTFCVAHLNPDGNDYVAFVIKDCLLYKYAMNSDPTNDGGWAESEMRTYLNSKIWDLLPDDLKAVIKPRSIKAKGAQLECKDNLWLLSWVEVFGQPSREEIGDVGDVHFSLFATKRDRIKNDEYGNGGYWWLRSQPIVSPSNFWYVTPNGGSYYGAGSLPAVIDIVFGFLV